MKKKLNFSGAIFKPNGDLKYLGYLYDYYREQMIRALLKQTLVHELKSQENDKLTTDISFLKKIPNQS